MRKTLFLVVVLLCLVDGSIIYWKMSPPKQSIEAPQSKLIVLAEPPPIVQYVNKKSEEIKSFSCKDFTIKVWMNGIRVKLTASLFYEKERKFRMTTKSFLGAEGDFGSNDQVFWFWSRRNKPPALHYAKYEDFYKTRLKSPFDPMFLRETLGLDPIKTDGARVVEDAKKFVIINNLKNSMGQPILKWTFIDRENQRINGLLITNSDGTPIASGEILKYENELPSQILYQWFEEKTTMLMEFGHPECNVEIEEGRWELPNITPQIDMGKD